MTWRRIFSDGVSCSFSTVNGVVGDDEAAHLLDHADSSALTRSTALPSALASAPDRRVVGGEFGIGHEQRDEVRAAVAIDHRLGDFGLQRQHPLDPLRRDIVALVVDDQILLAVGDDDPALVVEMADVAGRQPAVDAAPARFPPGCANSRA